MLVKGGVISEDERKESERNEQQNSYILARREASTRKLSSLESGRITITKQHRIATEEMPRIFISYRREDSIAYAGRLHDRLSAHFGAEFVFMDIDTIEPGADFVEVLEQTVASCDALLAVIGKQWLTAKDDEGQLRLRN